MEFLGQIIEILKCIGPPLCKYIEYHRKLEEYQKNLKRILDELQRQKDGIELRLKAECVFGKLTKPEVNDWLKNVEKIIDEAKNIEDKFKKVKCFSRVLRAELVDKKIQEVKEYYKDGTSFTSLVIDAPPPVGITLPATRLAGETTAKKNMEEIWGHLMGNDIKKIGVCGMGGAGKTTIVTHLNNKLIEENKFDHVIWVTVSQTLDLIKVQNGIAIALKQSLSEEEDQKVRAGKLFSMLKGKRFVLIFDDMWKAIRLEEIGIPEPTEENGCKLVITTRSLNVCNSMDCKTVHVKPLSEKEASELFFEKAKLDISKAPTLKEIVELVVKQCAGLPLAIVTIASSLKGEVDIREWRNALHELSNNVRSIKVNNDEVFVRLKFSYDRLKDERIQRCFLYCALYPEDHNIPKNELVYCWIAEGLLDEMTVLKAKEDMAYSIITSLVSNCLLLESTDWTGRSYVKLHDVVRDMTIRCITSNSPLFMVKAGLNLDELPSEREWKENLDKVSLMDNLIREIPSSMSPNCQILTTLLLQGNPLPESIPESFFSHMHGLKILNISGTQIESLPNSISELTNLTALLLQNCKRLKRVPSLAKLRALAKLELGYTAINEVPAGMEMLANLIILDLLCLELHMIPAGIFSKLCRLQKLRVNWGLETLKVAVEEATRLKSLNNLTAQFFKLQDFNCFMKSLNSHGILSEYCLLLCPNGIDDVYRLDLGYLRCTLRYDVNKAVILDGCNICGREEEDSIVLPKQVEFLRIRRCRDVRNISNIPTFNTLERLEILHVEDLSDLSGILSESSPAGQYSHLKVVSIYRCHKVMKLMSSKLILKPKNLEEIEVVDCGEMEEIIAIDDVDCKKELMISLPKLRKLILIDMPELKSIINVCGGSNGVLMVCDSLQVIFIWECPKLKKIISSSSSSKLQLGVLKNLEEIDVGGCNEMEEIIAIDDVDCKKELMISLPKLRELTLRYMPELKSIINVCGGSNGVLMVCDSLQQIYIWGCPQLKRFPIYLPIDEKGEPSPPPALNEIYVERSWWEALEWDHLHPNAKTLLLPFCRFSREY
ncbi:hypothetical protein LWI28_005688 [Acer negundo]|uniref:NB-ARC domain-containing protein n=1 Tax=Acer negundo TaxID=4023 RepID=A0AAD5JQ65_ACENE|nr:hypothetical protein LWI28_005688 [Acer negundo]